MIATSTDRGIRSAQLGVVTNALLAVVKLVAGVAGNAYALVADAVESLADVVSSVVVWGGLRIASKPADEDHPFGHGKAEAIAATIVAAMLVGAAGIVAAEAIRFIRTPHELPAVWTLGVLIVVMLAKWMLSRHVRAVARAIHSTSVRADAGHHLSDAVTSAFAFVGIGAGLVGHRYTGNASWAAADDWAALAAAGVIAYNGANILRRAIHDLMDRMPGAEIVGPVRSVAESVDGVLAVEKLHVRKVGLGYRVTLHVQADPSLTLDSAHALGHRVQDAIRAAVPQVQSALVHMEPYR